MPGLPEVMAELVYFIHQDHRILSSAWITAFMIRPGINAYICPAVAPNLRLVPDSAKDILENFG